MFNKASTVTLLKIFILGFAITQFFIVAEKANATTACPNATVHVVARDQNGAAIPGISYQILATTTNSDGETRPGNVVSSGKIGTVLGEGKSIFSPTSGNYIIKMYDKNATVGAFWFYDNLQFTCGKTKNITKNLSSISLTARDINGSLLKDYSFSLYLQKKDIDNNLLKTKDFLVVDSKTNANGQATVYVTGGDPAQYQDVARYLISLKYNNLIFDKPDISLTAGADTLVNYTLSGLNLTVVYAANNNLNKNASINIYEQKTDANKNKILVKNVSKISR